MRNTILLLCGIVIGLAVIGYVRHEIRAARKESREEIRQVLKEAVPQIARELPEVASETVRQSGRAVLDVLGDACSTNGENSSVGDAATTPAKTRPPESGEEVVDSRAPQDPRRPQDDRSPLGALFQLGTEIIKEADRTARRMAPPMSIEEQRAVGSEMNRLVLSDTPKWNDQRETHRAEQVFAKLLHGMSKKEVTCSLTLLDSQAINAFATAGGYVYATRGILTRFKSEAQLAMILGHELGHIEKAHPSEQIRLVAAARRIAGTDIVMYAQIGYRFLNNSHTKADEFEADEFGFRLCRKLGYQRPSLISVLEGLIDIEKVPAGGRSGPGSELIENLEYFLRSHPYTEERRNRLLNLDI